MDKTHKNGYTILETLVVVLLVGSILAVALPMLFRFVQVYRIQTAAQQIAINLRFARNAALKEKVKFQVKVNDASSSPANVYYVLYDKNRDGTYDTDTERYKHADVFLPPSITILTGGLTTATFDYRGGASTAGGNTITLKGTDLSQYEVTVTASGGVKFTKTVEGVY